MDGLSRSADVWGLRVPEFYLEMNPVPNAYNDGDTRLFITVTSGLIEYMETDELDAVLAHEWVTLPAVMY